MKKILSYGVGLSLLLYSTVLIAASPIVGSYRVQGTNPGGIGSYTGTAKIVHLPSPQGDKYHVEWNVGTFYMLGAGDVSGTQRMSRNSSPLALENTPGMEWESQRLLIGRFNQLNRLVRLK